MISNPGGLFDNAVQLYKKIDPGLRVKNRDLELIFSSGATLKFAYLDNPSDKYNFQGAELTFLGFDEIQQLTQDNVTYLFSRLRSTSVDYKKQIVATGNPDYDSFMRHWVEFALDERGIPIRRDKYPIRYMLQIPGGKLVWADTREELEEKYTQGKSSDESGILSFTFVPGTILDNPVLSKADPTYVSKLKALPKTEYERLYLGSWYARESASGYWKRDWVEKISHAPRDIKGRCRAWDLAFTKATEEGTSKNPDWTAGVLLSKNKQNAYTIENVVRFRDRAHVVEDTIVQTAISDGMDVTIALPNDPSGGGAYVRGLQKRLSEMGYTCKLVRPTRGKVQRFAPFSAVAEAGFVYIIDADWNTEYHTELETFDGTNKFKDDQADATSDAFYVLNLGHDIPTFSLPDLFTASSFGFN